MGYMRASWEKLSQLARAEVAATLAALPGPLRERAQPLPVTFERVPSAAFQAEGIEADTLGVFTGPAFGDEEHSASPLPPQIILFLENPGTLLKATWKFTATKSIRHICTNSATTSAWTRMS